MALTLPSVAARIYTASRQLIGGDDFNKLNAMLTSNQTGITAQAGGGQATATQLTAATSVVETVASANDSVKLPKGIPGLAITVQNVGANSTQVFTQNAGTINATVNGVTTGVAIAANASLLFECVKVTATSESWVSR